MHSHCEMGCVSVTSKYFYMRCGLPVGIYCAETGTDSVRGTSQCKEDVIDVPMALLTVQHSWSVPVGRESISPVKRRLDLREDSNSPACPGPPAAGAAAPPTSPRSLGGRCRSPLARSRNAWTCVRTPTARRRRSASACATPPAPSRRRSAPRRRAARGPAGPAGAAPAVDAAAACAAAAGGTAAAAAGGLVRGVLGVLAH